MRRAMWMDGGLTCEQRRLLPSRGPTRPIQHFPLSATSVAPALLPHDAVKLPHAEISTQTLLLLREEDIF